MLTRIKLVNFQKHANLEIHFDKRMTVVVGATDSGKSAVIRAIQWVCLNNLPGLAFMRHGAKAVRVELDVDGHTIARYRAKSKNGYSLDGKEFASFGNSVPEPIKEILKVSEMNFQSQHDAPFWMSLPSGELARQLNEVVDLKVIDTSAAHASLEYKRFYSRYKASQEMMESLDDDLQATNWIVPCRKAWQATEAAMVQVSEAQERVDRVSDYIIRLEEWTARYGTAKAIVTAAAGPIEVGAAVQATKDRLDTLLQARSKLRAASATIRKAAAVENVVAAGQPLQAAQRRLNRLSDRMARLEWYEHVLDEGVPDTSTLTQVAVSLTKTRRTLFNIGSILGRYQLAASTEKTAQRQLEKNQQELDKIKVCPTCGREME
jgi:DNA repair ATPase RecN